MGEYKVDALRRIVKDFTGVEIKTHNKEVKSESFTGVVFMMIDTMSGRKEIYESSIKFKPGVNLLIEPRMGLHMGRIYNVLPMKMNVLKKYEETLYDDSVAEVSSCGNSMTVISSAMAITGWCVRQMINFHTEYEIDSEILIDLQNNNLFVNKWE